MSPALRRYLEAGFELAQAVEDVIEQDEYAERLELGRVRNGLHLVCEAQRSLLLGDGDTLTMDAFRRIDGLRKLLLVWLRGDAASGSPDLTDLAGPCRIVKRAWRAVQRGVPPETTHHHPRGEVRHGRTQG